MNKGDKVKVVWNYNICSKKSNTYEYNGKIGTIKGFNSEYSDRVEVDFDGVVKTVFRPALWLAKESDIKAQKTVEHKVIETKEEKVVEVKITETKAKS
jgi:hypothetical protein